MLSSGISRLAPISFALDFDPEFYREIQPTLASADDAVCYRDWLFAGFEKGEPGSPRQFFADLDLHLETFPGSFHWKRYALLRRGLGMNLTRWSALRHFVSEGFEQGHRPVKGPDAGDFYSALGAHFLRKSPYLSVQAFELAQNLGGLDDHFLAELAGGYFELGQWAPALAAYEAHMRTPGAGAKTVCNGARAALKLNKIDQAFDILKAGKNNVAGAPEWREVLRAAIEAEFEAASGQAYEFLRLDKRSQADQVVTDAVARIVERFAEFDPLGVPLPVAPDAKVVILANVDLRQCTHYQLSKKNNFLKRLAANTKFTQIPKQTLLFLPSLEPRRLYFTDCQPSR